MNVTRTRAGLAALTPKKNGLPFGKVNDPRSWDAVCDAVLKEATLEVDEDVGDYSEIFAFFAQADGTTEPDCSGAVKDWQRGFSILNKSPPVDDSISKEMINDRTVFFLTLYNPYDDAQGDCRVIVCKEPVSSAQQAQAGEEADLKTGSGLLCLTFPNPFNRKLFFTQDQWERIGEAIANTGSFVAPSFAALAALLAAGLLP
nr:suface antigen 1 [Eimeria magna]